jgi:hypothetical protein
MQKQIRRRAGEHPPVERPDLDRLEPLFTIPEIAGKAKRSRASIYRDIAAKRLDVVKVGCSTRVTAPSYRKYAGISA